MPRCSVRWSALLSLALALAPGCGGEPSEPGDAGALQDGGGSDAGPTDVDAGSDGGVGVDSGPMLADGGPGSLDASTPADAGPAPVDGGTDGGAPDAGVSPTLELQNATATFSQDMFPVSAAIDGTIPTVPEAIDGWAVNDPASISQTSNQTAVFETTSDTPTYATGTRFTIELHQVHGTSHVLGAFRFSVTTADRSMFADGLSTGGDVGADAIWSPLTTTSAVSMSGVLTSRADASILASGAAGVTDVYTLVLVTPLSAITGLRLEVLEDPSLPTSGPGRAVNGNFVLNEILASVDASP